MASTSPWHRLYNTKRWYRLRYHQLQKQPLCEFHLKRNQIISATVVDHVKPHKGDEALFHDPDNLQSLCKRCHDSVKQRIENGGTVTEFDSDGRVIWYLALEVDRLNAVKKANEENAKVAAFVANLQAQNENARADLGVDVQGAGIGNKQRERLRERLSIERNYLDQQRELQSQYQSGDISQTVYDRETQALKDAQSERLEIQDDYYKQIDALQADWVTGARDGLADWVDDSTNYATSAADAMKSALSGISSNIVDMLNRNKASWKDWGVSVLKTLEQVMVNMAIANGVSSIGSLFGGASSSASSGTALQSYGAGLQFNAKGGVYSSSDLSQYSNSVVSSPTLFAFAKGAGLMGEAGPEAIMPLTRASDGSLGVRAMGTVGVTPGTGGAPQVNIQIDGNGNAQNQSSSGYEQFGREVGNFVDRRYRELIGRDISPGGAVWNMAKGGR